jgi:thioesterase domain-containing protein/acyl carrier protein
VGHVPPGDPLQSQVAAIWEQVLGVQPVGAHDNFFDLGGHSMAAIQLLSALKQATGVELSVAALFKAPTVVQQAQLIRQRDWQSEGSSLIPIQEGAGGPPIFFVHWAGGSVLIYRELIQLLDPALRVYGLQAYGLVQSVRPHTSIEQMANHYVAEIQALQPHGPYYLAGASMGGSIAFEMARQLEAKGEPTGLVALFDTIGRPNMGALPLRERVKLHAENIQERQSQSALGYLIERTMVRLRRMAYAAVIGLGMPLPRLMWDLRETTYYAFKHYRPGNYAGDVVLFRATERGPGSPKTPFLGWEQVVSGSINIIDIPGMHSTLLREPNVRVVATALDDLLSEARQVSIRSGPESMEKAVDNG